MYLSQKLRIIFKGGLCSRLVPFHASMTKPFGKNYIPRAVYTLTNNNVHNSYLSF
jgi:hypothetical protein